MCTNIISLNICYLKCIYQYMKKYLSTSNYSSFVGYLFIYWYLSFEISFIIKSIYNDSTLFVTFFLKSLNNSDHFTRPIMSRSLVLWLILILIIIIVIIKIKVMMIVINNTYLFLQDWLGFYQQ